MNIISLYFGVFTIFTLCFDPYCYFMFWVEADGGMSLLSFWGMLL